MDFDAALRTTTTDAGDLIEAAAVGWDRPVRHCPDWDVAELVRHTGHVLVWMAAIATSGERVSRRSLPPAPSDVTELTAWFSESTVRLIDVLADAGPEATTWTFSRLGDQRISWWARRVAAEVAVHRWDAQDAVGAAPTPVATDLATAGVEEFVTEFLPGLLEGAGADRPTGTLHLHATDAPCEWWADLDTGRVEATHAKADTAVRAGASDLLLWLSNRAADGSVEVLGDDRTAHAWSGLRF